ncbi:MAG TPA: metallophosphoesterase [Candidatus Angelobacter sp.]|jgi:Icc-related predicted phosphoesterase
MLDAWTLFCRFACLLAGLPLAAQTQPVDIRLNHDNRAHFIAYGDTRFTDPANTQAADPQVRRELVKAIAKAGPDFVTFGGDITYNGNDPGDWNVYDSETAVWREKHIRVYPALGNHDLHGDLNVSLANYFQRYPELDHSLYYSVSTGNLLMLTLDSALDETSGEQGDWLKKKIETVPAGVDFVVVVLHHPPYTSSSDEKKFGGGHSARPAEQALARFLEERQKHIHARIVVFAGHVHNYEHTEHGGVTYFVTGGGGAHAYPIERKPTDLFQSNEINYHYIDVKVEPGKMVAVMNRLQFKNGIAFWSQPDSVNITVSKESKAAASN